MTIKERQTAIQNIINKIDNHLGHRILTVPECLLMFPDYTLITVHNGLISTSEFQREFIKTVRYELPQHLMRAEVKAIRYDTNFGINTLAAQNAPVAILEI